MGDYIRRRRTQPRKRQMDDVTRDLATMGQAYRRLERISKWQDGIVEDCCGGQGPPGSGCRASERKNERRTVQNSTGMQLLVILLSGLQYKKEEKERKSSIHHKTTKSSRRQALQWGLFLSGLRGSCVASSGPHRKQARLLSVPGYEAFDELLFQERSPLGRSYVYASQSQFYVV